MRKIKKEIDIKFESRYKVYLFNDTSPVLERSWAEKAGLGFVGAATVKLLQKRFKFRFWFAGIIISYLLVIPVLNFVVPMIAVTFMLHTFEKCRKEYERT